MLCLLCKDLKRLVLVGDHHQLPPFVREEPGAEQGLQLSGLERMLRLGFPVVMLQVQYRMHETIMRIPSDLYYGGGLVCGVPDSATPFELRLPNGEATFFIS